jgi:serine protease Do
MRKGMLAGVLLGVLTMLAPASFAACCPEQNFSQGTGDDWQVMNAKGSYLGVEVNDVTKDRISALKLKDESGVEVTAVDGDAPAAKAGIKEHDVILSINGQKIESEEQLRRVIRETPAGRSINLAISRDGQPMNITATLGSRKNQVWVGAMPKIAPMPPMPPQSFSWTGEMADVPEVITLTRGTRIGAMVESITPQLADFFGVKDGNGLLVRSVEKGSVAERSGLKAGDVIVRVDKERINDLSDWRRMLRNKTGAVGVGVIRDKREQNLTVTIPDKKESGSLFNADDFAQMAQLRVEIADMPEMQEQARKAMLDAQKEFQAHRGEYDKAMAQAQKEVQKSLKDQQKQMLKLQKDLQKSFKMISFDYE